MKTDWHRVEYAGTTHEILLDIFPMDAGEAIDGYDLPADRHWGGGWRIEAQCDGTPIGTRCYHGLLGSTYYGQEDTRDVALEFLADVRRGGNRWACSSPISCC